MHNRVKTPEKIQKAFYVLVDHLIRNTSNCPHSSDSWSYFGKNIADIENDDTICPVNLRAPYLDEQELARLLDVFQKFASVTLFRRDPWQNAECQMNLSTPFYGITRQKSSLLARNRSFQQLR